MVRDELVRKPQVRWRSRKSRAGRPSLKAFPPTQDRISSSSHYSVERSEERDAPALLRDTKQLPLHKPIGVSNWHACDCSAAREWKPSGGRRASPPCVLFVAEQHLGSSRGAAFNGSSTCRHGSNPPRTTFQCRVRVSSRRAGLI